MPATILSGALSPATSMGPRAIGIPCGVCIFSPLATGFPTTVLAFIRNCGNCFAVRQKYLLNRTVSPVDGPLRVILNGKFLAAGPTGVHRVAEQLVKSVQARIDADPDLAARLALELWIPAAATAQAAPLGVVTRIVRPFAGVPWEQVTLPCAARGGLIVSLCNVGPVLATNAVTMIHDAQVKISPSSYTRRFRLWYRFHQGVAGIRHRRILTVSEFSRTQLDAYGIAAMSRIGVVHNGVDHFSEVVPDDAALRRMALEPQAYVVALANTQAHKNIAVLIRAFSNPALAGLRLVLFGVAGPAEFAAAGLALPENVIFAGRVSDAELAALYRNALCLAFPSRTEGFGLPPLEAMSVGCPAVVAPEGALPEVCGDAAAYAAADDVEQWVHQIRRMSDDVAHRQAMVEAGRLQAVRFTWDAAASRLIAELLALAPA